MKTMNQFCIVQRDEYVPHSKCKRDLDSQLQRRHGVLLNTSRRARAACGVASLRIAPTVANRYGGEFLLGHSCQTRALPSLNRETASCDTVAETYAGRLRALMTAVRAREETKISPASKQRKTTVLRMLQSEYADDSGDSGRLRASSTCNQSNAETATCGGLRFSFALSTAFDLPVRGRGFPFLSRFVLTSPSLLFRKRKEPMQ